MSRCILTPVLLLLVVSCTQAPPSTYLLRVKETAGAKWQYTYTVKTFVDPKGMTPEDAKKMGMPGPGSAEVTGTIDMEVKEVKEGKTTFLKTGRMVSSKGTGIWKAQAEEILKAGPDISTYTWDERMSNVNIAKGEFYDIMTNSFNTLLPKDPVSVGSEWEYKPVPDSVQMSKAKVLALESIHGRNTLKILLLLPGTSENKNTMTVWLDPTNGRYLKVDLLSTSSEKGLKSENHLTQDLKE